MKIQARLYSWIALGVFPIFLAGCGESKPVETVKQAEHHEGDGHDHAKEGGGHPTEGPHHGHLIELGEEEYHAELAHHEVTKSVLVFLLDKEAKNRVTSPDKEIALNLVVDGKPMQVKLPAKPEGGDPEGESSRYILVSEELLTALEAKSTTGRLTVTINGKEYSGALSHEKHGEHEHKE